MADARTALEESLLRARDDVMARPGFYRMLMEDRLFLPGNCGREGNGVEAKPGDQLKLAILRHNGRSYHPIFTTAERLSAFHESPYFTMKGRDLFGCTRGAEFVLNPNSDCGKILAANEIAFWLDPSVRARRRMSQAQVVLREPATYPQKLADALRILFASRQKVAAAHLLEMAVTDRDEPPHPLIGIEASGNWAKLSGEVSEIAGAVDPGMIVDLVALDDTAPQDLVTALRKAPAFYRRTEDVN